MYRSEFPVNPGWYILDTYGAGVAVMNTPFASLYDTVVAANMTEAAARLAIVAYAATVQYSESEAAISDQPRGVYTLEQRLCCLGVEPSESVHNTGA